MVEHIELGKLIEEKTRELVKGLLNFVEQLSRRLRDANNRLKGEQGKLEIKGL